MARMTSTRLSLQDDTTSVKIAFPFFFFKISKKSDHLKMKSLVHWFTDKTNTYDPNTIRKKNRAVFKNKHTFNPINYKK